MIDAILREPIFHTSLFETDDSVSNEVKSLKGLLEASGKTMTNDCFLSNLLLMYQQESFIVMQPNQQSHLVSHSSKFLLSLQVRYYFVYFFLLSVIYIILFYHVILFQIIH